MNSARGREQTVRARLLRAHALAAACCGAALLLAAPATTASSQEDRVTLRVSRNFQRPPLLEKKVPSSGRSVMEILAGSAQVKTACGGGFVKAIDGIHSGSGQDWFYYVNGAMPNVGALNYIPRPGDIVWWDIHGWQNCWPVPAVIGSYPHPFIGSRGEEAATIFYSDDVKEKAVILRDALTREGAAGILLQPIGAAQANGRSPTLFLGPWEAIKRDPLIRDMYANRRKCGFFISFDRDGLRAHEREGAPERRFPRAGAILALKRGFSNDAPVWLVTGTDAKEARRAADLIINAPQKISGMAGAIVTEESIYPLP